MADKKQLKEIDNPLKKYPEILVTCSPISKFYYQTIMYYLKTAR